MAHLTSAVPYRIVELDSPVPVRLIGPGGRQYDQLSNALSVIATQLRRRSDFTNMVSAFLWALSEARGRLPDPAAALEAGYADALDVQHQFLVAIGATTTVNSNSVSMWVAPPRRSILASSVHCGH